MPNTIDVVTLDPGGAYMEGWSVVSPMRVQATGVGFAGELEVTLIGSFQSRIGREFSMLESAGGWDIFMIHCP